MNRWWVAGAALLAAAVAALVLLVFIVLSPDSARAKELATLHVLEGTVEVGEAGGSFAPAADARSLAEGDRVRTGEDGRAEIRYFDGSITRLDYGTTFEIRELASIEGEPNSKIIRANQSGGGTFNRIAKITDSESRVEVSTPTAVASVRGTVFFTLELPDGSWIIGVLEGQVEVIDRDGNVTVLGEGEYVTVDPDGNVGEPRPLTAEVLAGLGWVLHQCSLDDEIPLVPCLEVDEQGVVVRAASQESPEEERELGGEGNGEGNPQFSSTNDENGGNDAPGDTTPPNTFITSGPSGLVGSSSATFAFISSETGSTFECSLDGAAFAPCASPRTYPVLADGLHLFRVRATDGAGNTDPTPAQRGWVVDTTPPETTITSGPEDPTNDPNAEFEFEADEPVRGFDCRLQGPSEAAHAFEPCQSPTEYRDLVDGEHTFSVRATDLAGNVEATAARTWTIDTEPPTVEITSGPADPTDETSATFTFTHEDGATVACELDDGGFEEPCDSPKEYPGPLPDGLRTFIVRATDAAGNHAEDSFSWIIDTGPSETNRPPQAPSQVKAKTEPGESVDLDLRATDPDDGDELSFIILTCPEHGTLDRPCGAEAEPIGGEQVATKRWGLTVRYTADAGFEGEDEFEWDATDGELSLKNGPATATIEVAEKRGGPKGLSATSRNELPEPPPDPGPDDPDRPAAVTREDPPDETDDEAESEE